MKPFLCEDFLLQTETAKTRDMVKDICYRNAVSDFGIHVPET